MSRYVNYNLIDNENIKIINQEVSSFYNIAVGPFFAVSKSQEVVSSYMLLKFNTYCDLYYPTIQIEEYQLGENNEWIAKKKARSQTLGSEFEEINYKNECFLSCNLHSDSSKKSKDFYKIIKAKIKPIKPKEHNNQLFFNYDLIFKEDLFCYTKMKNGKELFELKEYEKKIKYLRDVIDVLEEENKLQGVVYPVEPSQLNLIYILGTIFFTIGEAKLIAEEEFGEESDFSVLIGLEREEINQEDNDEIVNKYSHLDWANEIISNEIKEFFEFDEQNGNGKITLLEAGFGELRTLLKILEKIDLINEREKGIEYVGVDICEKLVEKSKKHYDNSDKNNMYWSLKNVESFGDLDELFYRLDLHDAVSEKGILYDYKDKFDVFVASYCFHHIHSTKNLLEITFDGSLAKYFNVDKNPAILWNSIEEQTVLSELIKSEKYKNFVKLARNIYNLRKKMSMLAFLKKKELKTVL